MKAEAPATATAPGDWPTYMHDNHRSGRTAERVPLPLAPVWTYTAAAPPAPAWPPPAPHDFFHRRIPRPRVVFDRAFHAVSADGRVFWGDSATDAVHAADLKTGKQLWRFCAEGPVRLAPVMAGKIVCFGSDDGCLYGLDAATGALLWKTRVVDRAPLIAGNGRVISLMPVRSGGLVHDGKVYFAAGLLPRQGMRYGMADVATGKIVAGEDVRIPLQGYLYFKDGKFYAQRGRAKPGPLAAKRRSAAPPADPGPAPPAESPEYPYAAIATPTHVFRGGEGKVAALPVGGPGPTPAWSAEVDGKAYGLAIARGRLLVSTDKGRIYCFAPVKAGNVTHHRPVKKAIEPNAPATAVATAALAACGRKKGYALILGAGPDGALAAALAGAGKMRIVIREPDPAKAAEAKARLQKAGLYGRISVHEGGLDRLPYTDYLFNLVLHPGLMSNTPYPGHRDEARRVVAPLRGVALLGPTPAEVYRRPALPGAGRWSHFYADPGNTACSGDTRITADLSLQWIGRPGPARMVDRHNRTVAPLSVNGRLFVSGVDWFAGVDAYNGTILWEKDVPGSLRMAAPKTAGNMAATDTHLYVASGASCLQLDAETGAEQRRFATTGGDWAYVATAGEMLLGSTVPAGSLRWPFAHNSWVPGYKPRGFFICSRDLFAFDRKTGQKRWTYTPAAGVIPCPAIAIGAGKVFFIESTNPLSAAVADGHVTLEVLLGQGAKLVAVDLKTGRKAWDRPVQLEARNSLYVSYKDGKVILSGSVNKNGAWYVLGAHDAATGRKLWERGFLASGNTSGTHGEATKHPTIVGETIFLYNDSFSLATGEPTPRKLPKSSCGERSASAEMLFWRRGGVMMANAKEGPTQPLSRSSRPGCWINIIPAGGVVLIPEASSGCTCNIPIQASMAFRPR